MKIGKYYTLEQLTVTKSGLKNTPNQNEIQNLYELCINVLDPLTDILGQNLKITSAFRSFEVNRHVGGSATSQHLKGQAVDLKFTDNKLLFDTIKDTLLFDQLIWESGTNYAPSWVHVSFNKPNNRHEVLRMNNGKYTHI